MAYTLMIYPAPLDAHVQLTPDGGAPTIGTPHTDPQGRPGQVCQVAEGTGSGGGAELRIEAPDYLALRVRGFLILDKEDRSARLQVDDYTLTADPTPPPPETYGSPEEIITQVYESTHPNLATVEGCGKFTEDVCTALHGHHSQAWGHIDKDPGQNQYNGHAVDAVMLLNNTPDTSAGIYDIIFSSASPEAHPAFNFVSPPNPEDWVYPAESATRGTAIAVSFRPRRVQR